MPSQLNISVYLNNSILRLAIVLLKKNHCYFAYEIVLIIMLFNDSFKHAYKGVYPFSEF